MAAGGGELFRPARQRLRLRLSALRAQGARQRPAYGVVPLDARAAARQRGSRDAAADAGLPARPGLARGALRRSKLTYRSTAIWVAPRIETPRARSIAQ